jgi:hypothetical protein
MLQLRQRPLQQQQQQHLCVRRMQSLCLLLQLPHLLLLLLLGLLRVPCGCAWQLGTLCQQPTGLQGLLVPWLQQQMMQKLHCFLLLTPLQLQLMQGRHCLM